MQNSNSRKVRNRDKRNMKKKHKTRISQCESAMYHLRLKDAVRRCYTILEDWYNIQPSDDEVDDMIELFEQDCFYGSDTL